MITPTRLASALAVGKTIFSTSDSLVNNVSLLRWGTFKQASFEVNQITWMFSLLSWNPMGLLSIYDKSTFLKLTFDKIWYGNRIIKGSSSH